MHHGVRARLRVPRSFVILPFDYQAVQLPKPDGAVMLKAA